MRSERTTRLLQLAIAAALATASGTTAFGATASGFTGGDVNEGLDLDGTFLYAVNVRGPAVGLIRDANFTDDAASGVHITAGNEIINWHNADYGATQNDDRLETVMQSIRWSNSGTNVPSITLDLDSLVPSHQYRLQLLFGDNGNGRGMDITAEGSLIMDNFAPGDFQTPVGGGNGGAVVTHNFTAGDSQLNLVLGPETIGGAVASHGDNNAILQGFTLEDLSATPESGSAAVMAIIAGAALARRQQR